jgi:hypothetical protein
MFQITSSAYQKLENILASEKEIPDEELYIRLSMGIG